MSNFCFRIDPQTINYDDLSFRTSMGLIILFAPAERPGDCRAPPPAGLGPAATRRAAAGAQIQRMRRPRADGR
jgi:hypothetical protein